MSGNLVPENLTDDASRRQPGPDASDGFARQHFEDCVICLQPISERAVAVPCNHLSFDFICLASWLQEQPQCPLCKAQLTAIEYDFRSPDDFKTFQVSSKPTKPTAGSSIVSSTSAVPRSPSGVVRTPLRNPNFRRAPLRRPRSSGPIVEPPDAALQRRRYVYRQQLFSLHVGSNRVSRFREFTPQDFSRSHELQSRAQSWIRRELQVFDFLNLEPGLPLRPESRRRRMESSAFLMTYTTAILKTVDLKDSNGKAQEMLAGYLGSDNARLFLHELGAWLRSPYTSLGDWDRHVQYQRPLPRFDEGGKIAAPDSFRTNDSRLSDTAHSASGPSSRPSHFTAPSNNRSTWRWYEPD